MDHIVICEENVVGKRSCITGVYLLIDRINFVAFPGNDSTLGIYFVGDISISDLDAFKILLVLSGGALDALWFWWSIWSR